MEQSVDISKDLKTKITELDEKIFSIEERWALGKIDSDLYERIGGKGNKRRRI
jgi:hypothetical protein